LLTSRNKIRRRKQVESEDKVRTDDYENENPPSSEKRRKGKIEEQRCLDWRAGGGKSRKKNETNTWNSTMRKQKLFRSSRKERDMNKI
jgi:hypothetical protein